MQPQPSITDNSAPLRSNRSSFSVALPVLFLFLTMEISQAGSATWNLNPTSGFWATATNWTPATVPNGPSDRATFAASNTTSVTISLNVELRELAFEAEASAFNIFVNDSDLTLDETGIRNSSGVQQNIVINYEGDAGSIFFNDGASAGSQTHFTLNFGSVAELATPPLPPARPSQTTAVPPLMINSFSAAPQRFLGHRQLIERPSIINQEASGPVLPAARRSLTRQRALAMEPSITSRRRPLRNRVAFVSSLVVQTQERLHFITTVLPSRGLLAKALSFSS